MTEEHKKPLIAPAAERAADVARADAALEASKDLSKKAWDESKNKEPWNSTAKGRFAIRTFSRGIMGAAFFTIGGAWSKKMMNPSSVLGDEAAVNNYLASNKFSEQKNPLQFLAKSIDTFVGKPLEITVNAFGGDGAQFTHFKPTKYKRIYPQEHFSNNFKTPRSTNTVYGRSLGEETIALTFDFFAASIGDAIGRDIVGLFDPAVKKEWVDDKGHVKLPEAMKSLAKTAWRYVSYNGGEDWAVALPYVYFVKAERNLIDKVSKGYQFESDIALNKGCLKMNTLFNEHRATGSYSMEAILDYQSRFTAYNMGTLLYREAYDKAAHALKGEHISLYGSPDVPKKEHETIGKKIHDTAKWGLRGIVKGFICMTPAVPFFSITRATQNRHLGLFIDPEKNAAMTFVGKDGKPHFVSYADSLALKDGMNPNGEFYYSSFNNSTKNGKPIGYNPEKINSGFGDAVNPSRRPHFSPYMKRYNIVENGLNTVGKFGNWFAGRLDNPVSALEAGAPQLAKVLRYTAGLNPESGALTGFTKPMLHASLSYTPYMYMKAETANLWDNGKMDLAVERMIDGADALKWKEFKAGAAEVRDAIFHRPFADAAREKEAHRRTRVDTSAADTALFDPEAEEKNDTLLVQEEAAERKKEFAKPALKKTSELGWQERLVKGRSEEGDVQPISTKHSPHSHAEREAMRKVLEESQPPTNSIH